MNHISRAIVRGAVTFVAAAAMLSPALAARPKPVAVTEVPAVAGTPAKYDTFVKGATVLPGLLGIIRNGGLTYLSIPKAKLGTDFVAIAVPATGLGGFGPAAGEPYVAPARILHFERADNSLIMTWPNTIATVTAGSPQARAANASLANSVVAVTPIVAESDTDLVIATAPFLGDIANLKAQFDNVVEKPQNSYHLDTMRSFLSDAKTFPQNTLLRVRQTWATDSPDAIDNVPDPRSVEVRMTYNIIAAPSDGYQPRLADPRVGYFSQPLLDFRSDANAIRNINYVSRWNFMPTTPGQPSVAKNPMIFTLSDTIPVEYRDPVKNALLAWDAAFERIGIQNAIVVRQQPDGDPQFDADDIRNNMVRWIDTSSPQYGAEALIVNDPRTGEEINVGVNVDAVVGMTNNRYRYLIAPARGLPDDAAAEKAYADGTITSIVLHEAGHDMGLQHNFIGSLAYTAKELQSEAFTRRFGIASSVMEYAPTNLWPKGTPQGDYDQRVLGPYDFYAIAYGYGYIPNATTPEAEKPTLNRLASRWSDPMYRFASDEDSFFDSGHAIDPRVQMDDLTNDPIGWERSQLTMLHGLMNAVDRRFPKRGESFDEARRAFMSPLSSYVRTVVMPSHILAGEYVSRANAGDPGASAPLQAVPRADEVRAWQTLDTYLFSDSAWHFSPNVLDKLTYSEFSSLGQAGNWSYSPPPRHDVAVVQIAGKTQEKVMNELFAPLTLQRIDDFSTRYVAGSTMSIADLFDWTRSGIFGDLADGSIARAGVVRRNEQMAFAKRLVDLWIAPAAGTPTDAQALARLQLVALVRDTSKASKLKLDEVTRAHVEALRAVAQQGLSAQAMVARPAPVPPM